MIASIGRNIKNYGDHLAAFRPNARLYLIYAIITGIAMGIFRLLFNFYILSLGYDEKVLGNLVTASSITALIFALPMGYLADLLGRKSSLLISATIISTCVGLMVIWPTTAVLYAMNILSGIAQSLAGVTMSPFLMENSSEHERTYLFSMTSGLQMVSASVGSWIGGYLPTWVAGRLNVEAKGQKPLSINGIELSLQEFSGDHPFPYHASFTYPGLKTIFLEGWLSYQESQSMLQLKDNFKIRR